MSKLNIKKFIATIMVLFVILSFNFITFSKTIDLNGINVSLNVETIKKQVGNGVDVKNNNKFSDTEYEKEKKVVEDEIVNVKISIKNKNSYENAKITIEESIPSGFRKIGNDNKNYYFSFTLNSYNENEYEYRYKYHKSYLKDQNNEFLYDSDGNIINSNENLKFQERNKETIIENENNNIIYGEQKKVNDDEEIRKNAKKNGLGIIIAIIVFFISICTFFILKILYKEIKGKEENYFGEDFNSFVIIVFLSIIISVILSDKVLYAKNYKPQIQEYGKSYTKVISERVKYNDVYYKFAYKVTVEYENTYEVTDEDYETDTDLDGLVDAFEYQYMTDKGRQDTDGDGISDYLEVMLLDYNPLSDDTFGDGIKDADRDYDLDGLTNKNEIECGTDLTLVDTDYDTLSDYDEINKYGTDPLSVDTDEDGLFEPDEIKLGLDPNNPITDGITLDSERKIRQEYNMEKVPEELRRGDVYIKNISGSVSGNIDNEIRVSDENKEVFNSMNSFVQSGFKVELKENETIDIELDVSKVSERKTTLILVKYENGAIEAIDTKCIGNILKANISSGIYSVMDSEIVLKDLNIMISDYMP